MSTRFRVQASHPNKSAAKSCGINLMCNRSRSALAVDISVRCLSSLLFWTAGATVTEQVKDQLRSITHLVRMWVLVQKHFQAAPTLPPVAHCSDLLVTPLHSPASLHWHCKHIQAWITCTIFNHVITLGNFTEFRTYLESLCYHMARTQSLIYWLCNVAIDFSRGSRSRGGGHSVKLSCLCCVRVPALVHE